MFKLPDGIPGPRADNQEWADYAEFYAISSEGLSFFNLVKPTSLISDEVTISGVDDDSDKLLQKADEISSEIRIRMELLSDKYPYQLENNDYSLSFNRENGFSGLVYRFLLLCTRIDMSSKRIIEQIDGSLLFELLSAEVIRNYFGPFSEVDILGTSRSSATNFREKLKDIFNRIGEGGTTHSNPNYRVQDDHVDLVVWINFTDKKPSNFIAFGQCKTGTSWVDRLSELNTSAFCNRWFSRQPVLTPVRMFFTAQYFPRDIWYERASEAGLVFDRFRIMEYLPETIDEGLLIQIQQWCDGAMQIYGSDND